MNDERNLICRNVMLLSQSCDENSFVRLCKIFSLRGGEKKNFLSVSGWLVVTTTEGKEQILI